MHGDDLFPRDRVGKRVGRAAAGQRHVAEADLIQRAVRAVEGDDNILNEGRRADRVAVRVRVTPADFSDVVAAVHDDRGYDQHLLAGSVRIEKVEAPVVATVVDGVNAAGREGRNIDGQRGERGVVAVRITIAIHRVVQTRSARAGEGDGCWRICVTTKFVVQRVVLQRQRESDGTVRAIEDASREVKHETELALRAADRGAGGGQRDHSFLQVTGDAHGSGIAVRVEGREVNNEELELVLLAGTQRARVNHEVRGRAFQGVFLAGRRGGEDVFILAIDDLDAEIIICVRVRDGAPGQGEIRRGINRLRCSEVAEERRAGIGIADDEQVVGLRSIVNALRHDRVVATRERGIERALRREERLEVKSVFESALKRNGGAAGRSDRCAEERLRAVRFREAHEDVVGTAIGNGRTRVRLHPVLAFDGAEEPDVRPVRLAASTTVREDDYGECPLGDLVVEVRDYDVERKCSRSVRLPGDGAGLGAEGEPRRKGSALNGPQIWRLTAVDLNRRAVGPTD